MYLYNIIQYSNSRILLQTNEKKNIYKIAGIAPYRLHGRRIMVMIYTAICLWTIILVDLCVCDVCVP